MKILCAMLALIPAAAFAAGPFDGTWKTRLDATDFSTKPEIFVINNGRYICISCAPKIDVKADGSDQAVMGHPYYDTISIKVLNDSSFRVIHKKAGKVMYDNTYLLSADHRALTFKLSDQTGAAPVTGEILFKRATGGPAGSHAASGSWLYDKIKSMSDNGITVTYTETADGLKMSAQSGQSYEAKFDGKEVLTQGDPGQTMVSLKRIGPREIEETDKRDGKVVDISTIKISADGKTMIYSDHDVLHDRTDMFMMEKQP